MSSISTTSINTTGNIEAKSPANAALSHVRQAFNQAVSSPAKLMMISSPSHANIPSPATFAKLTAAVGVQNPLDDTAKSNISTDGINSTRAQDPLLTLLANADTLLDDHLEQLEKAGILFFDEYENAFEHHSDAYRVVEAHRNLLALYDQLVNFATQSGLAAIPCPEEGSKSPAKAETLDEIQERLMSETKLSFEKRERLREGAAMVTSILLQTSRLRPH